MRIITRATLREFGNAHANARDALLAWHDVARAAWRSLADVRQAFPAADGVEVGSGRTATVFDIRGNHYRLIPAIHYNTQRVYVLRFLTHTEYSRDTWKDTL